MRQTQKWSEAEIKTEADETNTEGGGEKGGVGFM